MRPLAYGVPSGPGSVTLAIADRQSARTTVPLSGALSISSSMPARSAKCCITKSSSPAPRKALSAASNTGPLSRISSAVPVRNDFSNISIAEQPARRAAWPAASCAMRYRAAAASGAGCAVASANTRTFPLKFARRRPASRSKAARNPTRSATAGFSSRLTSRTSPMAVSSMGLVRDVNQSHGGLQHGLDFADALGNGNGAFRQVHAQEVELQAGGAETLSDAIVQELGEPRAIAFQGFERAQHKVALRHLVRHASGKGDFAVRRLDREHGD